MTTPTPASVRLAQSYQAFQYDGTNLADLLALLSTSGQTYVAFTTTAGTDNTWTLITISGTENSGDSNANLTWWLQESDWFVVPGAFDTFNPASTYGQQYVLSDSQYQQMYAA